MVKDNNKCIIQAVALFAALALLVIFCAVSVSAIVPPINVDGEICYNSGKPTFSDASYCAEILEYMYELNFFQTGDFLCFGKPTSSSSTRVYTSNNSDVTISNGTVTLSREGDVGYVVTYDFTTQGIAYRSVHTEDFTFELADWICCVLGDGEFIVNSDYSGGTLTNPNIVTLHASWLDYYNKVFYYDENIETAYDQGVDDGYETGYTDGLSTGLAQGLEQGKAAGLIQGRQEGYETGFDEGYDTGYADGLGAGYMIGYDDGLDEGYDTGFDDGFETGYDVGFYEGYDTGFDDGYETGYDVGIANGESSTTVIEITENIDVGSIISALPEGAKSIINDALDIDIFGINVAGTLTSILIVAIVGFVIKWLMTR